MTERLKHLRQAWSSVVEPQDYDAHMAAIGQAQANAHLIRELITICPPAQASRLLFAGAGTGQMFDYVSPDFLKLFRVTFSDIRSEFLDVLRSRLCDWVAFETLVDDIEAPKVGPIDSAAIVLVLEHVNWQQALRRLIAMGTKSFYVIVQVNPQGLADAVTPTRILPPSMARVSSDAKPKLVPTRSLARFMRGRGFRLVGRRDVAVADGKKMAGRVFLRR